ncbi:putative ribonuclease H-like domain-containing protein [Tanacetum coccineum]
MIACLEKSEGNVDFHEIVDLLTASTIHYALTISHTIYASYIDNGTEFKNNDMNQNPWMKGIKREFSVARTPQQNEVAERKNRTLIEAARTMLADSFLPITFWAEYPQSSDDAVANDVGKKITEEPPQMRGEKKWYKRRKEKLQIKKEGYANSTNRVSTVSRSVSFAGQSFVNDLLTDPLMPNLEDTTDI